jgi:hypothetical protein
MAIWQRSPAELVRRGRALAAEIATDRQTGELPTPEAIAEPRVRKPDGKFHGCEVLSRIDLAVDFQGEDFFGDDRELRSFLCRARSARNGEPESRGVGAGAVRYGDPGERSFTGYTWGSGARGIMCRLYLKTLELAQKGKEWMREVWEREPGYVRADPVWRLEIELKREVLADLGVSGWDASRLPSLWGYAVGAPGEGGWISRRRPDGCVNRSRWPVSDDWLMLQRASFGGPSCAAVRERHRFATLDELMRQAIGVLTTAAGYMGTHSDPAASFSEVLSELQKRTDRQRFAERAAERKYDAA